MLKFPEIFPEHIYPTLATLLLKEGSQVMFVRNDPSAEKLYYNGKIGKITKLSNKSICVVCPGNHNEIVVESGCLGKYQIHSERGDKGN